MVEPRTLRGSVVLQSVVTILILTVLFGGTWLYQFYRGYRDNLAELEETILEAHRKQLTWRVGQAIDFIHHKQSTTEERVRALLKERVYEAHASATHLWETHGKAMPRADAERLIRESLRPIRFEQGRGYYFIRDMQGIVQLFPVSPEREGTREAEPGDPLERQVNADILAAAATPQGEGFVEYEWTKPGATGRNHRKISFVKHFEPFGWAIGTGEYVEDVEALVQAETLEWLGAIRFETDDYIFAGTFDGTSLSGPARGQNMLDVEDAHGVKIVQELIRLAQGEGGFFTYVMPALEGQRPSAKLSYVRGVPEWGWYVGAGEYLDDIEAAAAEEEANLWRSLESSFALMAIALAMSLGLSLFLAIRFSAALKREFGHFHAFFDRAATAGALIDTHRLGFSELRQLALSANHMTTRRAQIEDELRLTEQRYQNLMHAATMGIFVYRAEPDGTLLLADANPAAANLVEGDPVQWLGKPILDSFPLRIDTGRLDELVRVAREGGELSWEAEKTADSDWHAYVIQAFHVEKNSAAISLIDVTERKRAEAELAETQALLTAAVEASPAGILIADAPDVRIRLANSAALGIRGDSSPVLTEIPFQLHPERWQVFHPDGTPFAPEELPLSKAVLTGETSEYVDAIIRHKDGKERWVLANAAPVRNVRGEITAGVVVFVDVTEYKELESQLRQAQKMEAVGQLAGGVAHDFNNLLQAVRGYTELALDEIEPGHPAQEALTEVAKAGERASLVVRQLLAFSRRQILQTEDVSLNELVSDMMKMLGRVIGEDIRLDFTPGGELGTVHVDRGQIEQVLMNLCVNARDAMPEGGRLTITTWNASLDEALADQHAWARPGEYVVMSVADSGHGMDSSILDHIFEPFFSTKETGKGSGLGLSMVYGIVKQHDGLIDVVTQRDRGTDFRIYLPRIEAPAPETDGHVQAPSMHLESGAGTILIAEDEAPVRELARRFLERAGYTVLTANDGNEATAVFERNHHAIDLVILDLVMPGQNGRAVYERIRGLRPELPVLFSSGYSAGGIHSRFILEDGLELIQKPFSSQTLLDKVREMLAAHDKPSPPSFNPAH